MGDFIIIGDTERYKDCLIYVCGTEDNAHKVLHNMLTSPTDDDKEVMATHGNLRIKEVTEENCWWHGNLD